jgi:pimeloyl-ACP methyl ester carboxylesterase
MSVFTEKSDLEAVLHMIQTENFADPEQIYLLGESQGGLVSAITANDHPDEIKGLFLVYPALCIPDDARSRFRNISDIPDKIDIMGLTVGRAYYENLLDYDVYQHMAGYTGPVSIFHGTADDIVDPSYSQRAVETYTNAELTMLPGEGHGFSTAGEQKVGSAILEKIL